MDFFENVYELSEPIYAIWNVFDLGSHVEKIKKKHPDWSERQLKCCLYWQPGARKKLKEQIVIFLKDMKLDGYSVTTCPEAMGVNITETMKSAGIELEWPLEKFTYQIALAGKKKEKNNFTGISLFETMLLYLSYKIKLLGINAKIDRHGHKSKVFKGA